MEEQLKSMTNYVLERYYSSCNRERINLQVEYVNDLYARRLELAYSDRIRNEVICAKEFIEGLNGTMVLPRKKGDVCYIVMSKNVIGNSQFISTIIHELTHIYDFIDFASEFCEDDYEYIDIHDLFGPFYFWTEFNARRKGYYYYRDIHLDLVDEKLSEEEQIKHILQTELNLHSERLFNDLREYLNARNNQFIYSLIQFLGRFSVWEDLFPEVINSNNHLPDYLKTMYGEKVICLYELLHTMKDFTMGKNKLVLLRDVLNELTDEIVA